MLKVNEIRKWSGDNPGKILLLLVEDSKESDYSVSFSAFSGEQYRFNRGERSWEHSNGSKVFIRSVKAPSPKEICDPMDLKIMGFDRELSEEEKLGIAHWRLEAAKTSNP